MNTWAWTPRRCNWLLEEMGFITGRRCGAECAEWSVVSMET